MTDEKRYPGWGGPRPGSGGKRTPGPGKKLGRPKGSTGPRLEAPRRKQIAVRLDETTAAAFRELCQEAEMTSSERVRLLIEQDILREKLTPPK